MLLLNTDGRNSVAGVSTRYGLMIRTSKPGGERQFQYSARPTLKPLVQRVWGILPREIAAGSWR